MCAIAGINWQDKTLVDKMTSSMRHRGPDGNGVWGDSSVTLGHRRLSIIDLTEKGRQPMHYKNYEIVFNGEIYNFRNLKARLKLLGHKFRSGSDTEVILHAYDEWGEKCVSYFNGMWAFCIYDRNKKILFLSRDRFGIKPLYYYYDKKRFVFASELNAISKVITGLELEDKAVNFYFYQKYIGGELTIYKKCYKLLPSYNLSFDLNTKKLKKNRYWNLEKEIRKDSNTNLSERLEKIETLTKDAVEKRLIADVPVGSFLSGGLDSSLVSALIAQNHRNFQTFSIGFKQNSYDEIPYSRIAADYIKTKHNIKYFDFNDEYVADIIKNLDEPFGDSSLIPTHLLSKFARAKVTVSLSGDGGDEVFAGYDSYQAHQITKYIPPFILDVLKPVAKKIKVSDSKLSFSFKLKKFIMDYSIDINTRHANWMSTFNEENRKKLMKDKFIPNLELPLQKIKGNSLLSVQLHDIYNYLPGNILKKTDAASMQNSLEVRVPFLDYRLVPLVLSLPEKYRINGFKTKYLLKQIAKNFLPDKIINRKKRGFTVPLSDWVGESKLVRKVLTDKIYYKHGYLDKEYVKSIYKIHCLRRQNYARQLWLIFVLNLWAKEHINEKI